MNLEELKSIWQEVHVREVPGESLVADELRQLLGVRSRRAIRSLNRMIWWESAAILLMAVLLLAWLLEGGLAYSGWELLSIVLFVGVSARFYWVKYQALNQPMLLEADLKTALQGVIRALDQYTRFYFFLSVVCVPFFAAGGVIYGLLRQGAAAGLDPHLISLQGWIVLLLVTFAFSGGMVFFTRWYTRRYYRRQADHLKACLQELEERVSGQ